MIVPDAWLIAIGPPGASGSQGARGPTGQTGSDGPRGLQGAPGAAGETKTVTSITKCIVVCDPLVCTTPEITCVLGASSTYYGTTTYDPPVCTQAAAVCNPPVCRCT